MTKITGLSPAVSLAQQSVLSSRQEHSTVPNLHQRFTRSAGSQPDGMKRSSSEVVDPMGANKRPRVSDPRTAPALNPFYDPTLDQYLGLEPAAPDAPALNPSYDPSLNQYLGGNRAPGT
jgi:hypothetical protein